MKNKKIAVNFRHKTFRKIQAKTNGKKRLYENAS